MRLDKFLADTGKLSRREASVAVKRGRVTVDGTAVRDPARHIDPDTSAVVLDGETVIYSRFTYLLLNKPEGYVSSTEPGGHTVMALLPPEYSKKGLFPCGRLDRDTTGVLLITDDGEMAHLLLSPKRHVTKDYRVTLTLPAASDAETRFSEGISLGEEVCAPAVAVFDSDRLHSTITLTEGKFHQVKRMFHAVGTDVETLRRVRFGPLEDDPTLAPGEWRELTPDEVAALAASAGIER